MTRISEWSEISRCFISIFGRTCSLLATKQGIPLLGVMARTNSISSTFLRSYKARRTVYSNFI